jgi:uncharacterized protein (DUF169 family)
MDFATQGKQLREILGLKWPPVALAFQPSAPPHIPRVDNAGPSGCTYWKLAAEGEVFYTEASDHYNCPIGAYTHGIELPPAQGRELEGLVGTMIGLEYLRQEEVATIPRRDSPFGVALYAPLAEAPFVADVVIVRGNAKQLMLLAEAASAAGLSHEGGMMGRPTCAMVPEALRSGHVAVSFACIGNRVYTELADDELYAAVPGPQLARLIDKLTTIVRANRELENFHRTRMTGGPPRA